MGMASSREDGRPNSGNDVFVILGHPKEQVEKKLGSKIWWER